MTIVALGIHLLHCIYQQVRLSAEIGEDGTHKARYFLFRCIVEIEVVIGECRSAPDHVVVLNIVNDSRCKDAFTTSRIPIEPQERIWRSTPFFEFRSANKPFPGTWLMLSVEYRRSVIMVSLHV